MRKKLTLISVTLLCLTLGTLAIRYTLHVDKGEKNMSSFTAQRVTRTYAQKIFATPDKVFPLLDPAREREWLDGWDYTMIYSMSGIGEEGCVFKTQGPHEEETIWTVTERDEASHEVEFVMVTPNSRVGRLKIRLEDNRDGTTTSNISYTFTALSAEGNEFIVAYTEEDFNRRMMWWEESMNHFLKTGNLLKTSGH